MTCQNIFKCLNNTVVTKLKNKNLGIYFILEQKIKCPQKNKKIT